MPNDAEAIQAPVAEQAQERESVLTHMSQNEFSTFLNSPTRRGHARKSVGGGQVAAICGLSSYSNPRKVFLDILELSPVERDRPVFERGRMMEPIIAEKFAIEFPQLEVIDTNDAESFHTQMKIPMLSRYARDHGKGIWDTETWTGVLWDRSRGHLRGTPDRMLLDAEGSVGVLEIKCLGEMSFSSTLREGVSPEYYAQIQLYMYLTGASWGYFAIFNADSWRLHAVRIEYDARAVAWMLRQVDRFWSEMIIRRTVPAQLDSTVLIPAHAWFQGRGSELPSLTTVTSQNSTAVPTMSRVMDWVRDLRSAKEQVKLYQLQAKGLEDNLKGFLDHQSIPGFYERTYGLSVKWTAHSRRTLNQERLSSKTLLDPHKVRAWMANNFRPMLSDSEMLEMWEQCKFDIEEVMEETPQRRFTVSGVADDPTMEV